MRPFECTVELTKEDCFTHKSIYFDVPRGVKELVIKFSYTPKIYDGADALALVKQCYARYGYEITDEEAKKQLPLVNLITLSLDAPEGTYLGAAHRHAPEQEIHITKTTASEGFFPHTTREGRWRAVLSMHAILSEKVRAKLIVEGLK